MRHLLTSLALLATFAAAGQTANPFPYNPDADTDGWISVNDLLSLLAIFTSEFTPESWETDSLSAAVVLNGNISYFECQRACNELEGHWRMADIDAFGKHWNLVAGENANHWVNSNSSLGSHEGSSFYEINGNGAVYPVNTYDLSFGKRCMCHLLASPFVPDVLTSETAGLQDQIDALGTNYDYLLDEMLEWGIVQDPSQSDTLTIDIGLSYSDSYQSPVPMAAVKPFVKFVGSAPVGNVYFELAPPSDSVRTVTFLNASENVVRGNTFTGGNYLLVGEWLHLIAVGDEWFRPWHDH